MVSFNKYLFFLLLIFYYLYLGILFMFYAINQILPNMLNIDSDWRINLLKNWVPFIGQLSSHMRLEKISDNTLIIGVYEPQWMQELFMLSKFIIDKINSNLGHKYIENLKFKLVERNIPNIKDSNPIQKDSKINAREYKLNLNQKNALNEIKDDQLRESLYTFLINCTSNR